MTRAPTTAITGPSSGIGRALALDLAARGHELFLLGRGAKLAEVAAQVARAGGRSHAIALDLQHGDRIARAFEEIAATTSGLDALVNNAGVCTPEDLTSMSTVECDELLAVNLLGPILCTRSAIPLLRQRRGRVVNVASIAAREPIPGQALYSASKAGQFAFGQAMRSELRDSGIGVTTVFPGKTTSGILRRFGPADRERFALDQERRLDAADVARAIAFALEQPAHVCVDEIVITRTDEQ